MMPVFLRLQLVNLGRGHYVRPTVSLEPITELNILFHPSPARVQNDDAQPQSASTEQITLDERPPLTRDFPGDFREPISWQIDETIPAIDLEEIDVLRTTRPRAGARQPDGSDQLIQKAGLADVAAAQKSDLHVAFGRKLLRLGCTHYKLCRHTLGDCLGQTLVRYLIFSRACHDLRRG